MTAGEYDPEMPARLARAASEALERALADLAPARLASAVVPLHLARNRRFADGAADSRLALLRADFADGRPPVLLFEYGAHATLLSPGNVELSADWPGAARAALGDTGWRAIFVPGPLGDQEPVVELGAFASVEHEREVMKAFGQTMAKSVDAAARALEPGADAEPKLTALERWVDTPPAQFRRFCSLWWIAPFAGSSLEAFVSKRVPFQVLRAGDAAGFKANDGDGHCLQNRSAHDVQVLEIGTRVPGSMGHYSDIDMIAQPGGANYAHRDGTPYPKAERRGA